MLKKLLCLILFTSPCFALNWANSRSAGEQLDYSVVNRVDVYKYPSATSGSRIQVNSGTPVTVDTDLLITKPPTEVNPGIGVRPDAE